MILLDCLRSTQVAGGLFKTNPGSSQMNDNFFTKQEQLMGNFRQVCIIAVDWNK